MKINYDCPRCRTELKFDLSPFGFSIGADMYCHECHHKYHITVTSVTDFLENGPSKEAEDAMP